MAIVINGSGTVTGLAVGGLPDGTVDAGTLATNSVDSAELVDGSIDTAHIGTDQITSAILPTGSVIQVVSTSYTPSSHATFTSTSYADSGLTLNITPSTSGNKILCLATLNARAFADSNSDMDGWNNLSVMKPDYAQLVERRMVGDNLGKLGDSVWFPYSNTFEYLYTTDNANAHTFKMQIKADASNRTHQMYTEMTSTMVLMEIKA